MQPTAFPSSTLDAGEVMWCYSIDVQPGVPLMLHALIVAEALRVLLKSARLEHLEPVAKPRAKFYRRRPEFLLPNEPLTHAWLVQVRARRLP